MYGLFSLVLTSSNQNHNHISVTSYTNENVKRSIQNKIRYLHHTHTHTHTEMISMNPVDQSLKLTLDYLCISTELLIFRIKKLLKLANIITKINEVTLNYEISNSFSKN